MIPGWIEFYCQLSNFPRVATTSSLAHRWTNILILLILHGNPLTIRNFCPKPFVAMCVAEPRNPSIPKVKMKCAVWEVLKTLVSKKGTALIDISKWTYSVLSRSRPTFHQHNWKHSQSAKGCAGTLNVISEQILLIFYTLSTA